MNSQIIEKTRPHQDEAIKRFINHYYDEENERGILSMCCGSGKTYTFYSIMRECIKREENFFMFVTSRVLLIQSIVEEIMAWNYVSPIDRPMYIFIKGANQVTENTVCKKMMEKYRLDRHEKKNIRNKTRIIRLVAEDGDIEMKALIEKINGDNIVLYITTYASCSDVVRAIKKYNKSTEDMFEQDKIEPDLIILDEAHNLVSEKKSTIALLGDGDNTDFAPHKFLFMTATPLEIVKMDQKTESETETNEEKYSMHNSDIYGKIFYEYSFSDGIKDKHIVDFNMIYPEEQNILCQDLEILKNKISQYSKTEKNKLYYSAIAHMFIEAWKKYKFHHTIIYTSDTKQANLMKSKIDARINELDMGGMIKTYVIVSKSSGRDENIRSFSEECNGDIKARILISVNIFNEGVDIPICDSVFFSVERRSHVTIVQNIGRALRNYRGKEIAYVIIPSPIYNIDGDENYDETQAFSSKYKDIRKICDLMRKENNTLDKNTFLKRYVAVPKKKTFGDDDLNDELENHDEVINIKSMESMQDIDDDQISDKEIDETAKKINENRTITDTGGVISNISLAWFKSKVAEKNIKSMVRLGKFSRAPLLGSEPHIFFEKEEWTSYSDILDYPEVSTFDFEEANDIAKKMFNKYKAIDGDRSVDVVKNFMKWFNSVIKNLLDGNQINGFDKNKLCDQDFLKEIMRMPNYPMKYYANNWENNGGWSGFLGQELQPAVVVSVPSNGTCTGNNGDRNLKNIINNDGKALIELQCKTWQNYNYKIDLESLKKYIFDISQKKIPNHQTKNINQVNIRVSYLLKKNGKSYKYGAGAINFFIFHESHSTKPVTVTPFKSIKYGQEQIANIGPTEMKNIVDKLFDEVKEHTTSLLKK